MRSNGVRLETNLADGLPLVMADPVQLQQVILNLVMKRYRIHGPFAR
jgi:C4-dicarboxylate-specific signal transduction histidine kinase